MKRRDFIKASLAAPIMTNLPASETLTLDSVIAEIESYFPVHPEIGMTSKPVDEERDFVWRERPMLGEYNLAPRFISFATCQKHEGHPIELMYGNEQDALVGFRHYVIQYLEAYKFLPDSRGGANRSEFKLYWRRKPELVNDEWASEIGGMYYYARLVVA